MKKINSLIFAFLTLSITSFSQDQQKTLEDYIRSRAIDIHGREIVEIIVPGMPPDKHREPIAIPTRSAVTLASVPAFSWSFGCSATSAAMAAGYYDNNGYANMYTGPTNGGVMPMNNSSWGTVVIGGETRAQCPLSATRNTVDGRTTRGHVDDYWIVSNNAGPDPFIVNSWTEHAYGDCTSDYMGTNQSALGNIDGGTTFYNYTNGSPLYDYTGCEPAGRDGCHGLRDFYESRGYEVVQNYSQYIYGYNGNTLGFTFDQYKQEIDNGRVVLIQVSGHTMLGYGYDDAGSTVYVHDTWDYNNHSMTWGGSYSGLQHYGVTVVEIEESFYGPFADFTADNLFPATNTTVNLTDLSTGNPTPVSWAWTISPSSFTYVNSTSSSSMNPQVQFMSEGLYTISLNVSNGTSNDTETKTDYIHAYNCSVNAFPLSQDFSEQALPPCWSNVDNEGNGQVWQFNNPGGRTFNSTTASNGFAILDSDHYGSGNSQDCDLVTPLLDLSNAPGVILTFQHHFVAYAGSSATLSYSINGGNTWTALQTWTTTTANAAVYNQNLSAQLAGQPNVRFKWNYTGTYGYYWAVDDIEVHMEIPGIWTGATSAEWNLPANWADGVVPGSSLAVTVYPTAETWPVFSGDFIVGTHCGSLTLKNGTQMTVTGDMTIPAGKSLVFDGSGQLIIGGDWNNYGTFTPGSGTIEFNGSSPAILLSDNIISNTVTDYTRSTFTVGMTNVTAATSVTAGDNVYTDVPLGFSFTYMGNTYSQARLTSNGYLSFDLGTAVNPDNATLFTSAVPNATLAPWWDDLKSDGTSLVRYKTTGSAPNRIFTAEWYRILTYSTTATSRLKFQVKLYETTRVIEFHYGTTENGTHHADESASIGLEDAGGGSGHFIEATTGSTTTGISTLKHPAMWPTVNYRFTPATGDANFHNIVVNKSGTTLNINCNINLTGTLTIQPGSDFRVQGGKTVKVQ